MIVRDEKARIHSQCLRLFEFSAEAWTVGHGISVRKSRVRFCSIPSLVDLVEVLSRSSIFST